MLKFNLIGLYLKLHKKSQKGFCREYSEGSYPKVCHAHQRSPNKTIMACGHPVVIDPFDPLAGEKSSKHRLRMVYVTVTNAWTAYVNVGFDVFGFFLSDASCKERNKDLLNVFFMVIQICHALKTGRTHQPTFPPPKKTHYLI